MAASAVIAPQLVMGAVTFGPVDAPDGWTSFELLLDIVGLTGADAVAELSVDGGASWSQIIAASRLQPSPDTWRLAANCPDGMPAGQVRVTIANDVPFSSLGGSLKVY